jgi:hypothetical protein
MSLFQVRSDVPNGRRKAPLFKFSLTGFAQRVGRQCRFNARRDAFRSHINLEDVRPHKEHPHFRHCLDINRQIQKSRNLVSASF